MTNFKRHLSRLDAITELRRIYHATRVTQMISVDPDVIAGVLGYGEQDGRAPHTGRKPIDLREFVRQFA